MSTATANTVSALDLQRYSADPMAFFAGTMIPGPGVDVRLGDVWAPFQVEAFQVLADCIVAVAIGQKPPYRGLWVERTKGASKDSDVGLASLWLLMFARHPQLMELGADDQDQILETSKAMAAVVRCNPWIQSRVAVQRSKILCEATASECTFLTRDASGSHGSRPTVTVCNELAHCSDADFIATMMDNADKMPTNLAILATNAGELKTWQHRWRENYRQDPAWWFQKVDSPAPWIDPSKVADAERRNAPAASSGYGVVSGLLRVVTPYRRNPSSAASSVRVRCWRRPGMDSCGDRGGCRRERSPCGRGGRRRESSSAETPGGKGGRSSSAGSPRNDQEHNHPRGAALQHARGLRRSLANAPCLRGTAIVGFHRGSLPASWQHAGQAVCGPIGSDSRSDVGTVPRSALDRRLVFGSRGREELRESAGTGGEWKRP